MSGTTISIGPLDHGRRMSLDKFDQAAGRSGHVYELGRGVVTVVEVPDPRHFAQVHSARRQFAAYDLSHAAQIYGIASGSECKIVLASLESERHPDLAIYKTAPPDEADVWAAWIPEIALEVVSPGSEERDYVEKREEYLLFGIIEYWILDLLRREMLVLRRSRGSWTERIVRPPESYRTRLLPGFEFDCGAVFRAAEAM